MLNLSVTTKLKPIDLLHKSLHYFKNENGLKIIEIIVHLHGQKGAVELKAFGNQIISESEYTSEQLVIQESNYLKEKYGLQLIFYQVHLHSTPDESVGHLLFTIKPEKKSTINFESVEFDQLVKQFSASLPK